MMVKNKIISFTMGFASLALLTTSVIKAEGFSEELMTNQRLSGDLIVKKSSPFKSSAYAYTNYEGEDSKAYIYLEARDIKGKRICSIFNESWKTAKVEIKALSSAKTFESYHSTSDIKDLWGYQIIY